MALLLNQNEDKFQKLKVSRTSSKDNKLNSIYSHNSNSFSIKNEAKNHTGGYSCHGRTVVVKSNYEIAGRMKKDGTRATRKQVGSHASASLDYMNNHGAEDIKDQNLSNIYDENGDRLSKEELKEFSKELEKGENQAMRRMVVSPGQDMSRGEMIELVKNSMNDYMEEVGKSFEYRFAIHTDTDHIHAHVLATGDAKDINMTKTQLNMIKSSVSENTQQILHNREHSLDKELNKELDKEIELSRSREKELDNKIELSHSREKETEAKTGVKSEKDIDEVINKVYGMDKQEDMSLSL